jgi:hypothetical protein
MHVIVVSSPSPNRLKDLQIGGIEFDFVFRTISDEVVCCLDLRCCWILSSSRGGPGAGHSVRQPQIWTLFTIPTSQLSPIWIRLNGQTACRYFSSHIFRLTLILIFDSLIMPIDRSHYSPEMNHKCIHVHIKVVKVLIWYGINIV